MTVVVEFANVVVVEPDSVVVEVTPPAVVAVGGSVAGGSVAGGSVVGAAVGDSDDGGAAVTVVVGKVVGGVVDVAVVVVVVVGDGGGSIYTSQLAARTVMPRTFQFRPGKCFPIP